MEVKNREKRRGKKKKRRKGETNKKKEKKNYKRGRLFSYIKLFKSIKINTI